MRDSFDPVQYPNKDFHVLFCVATAGQDATPVVRAFLERAVQEGLVDAAEVVGQLATPLGRVAVLENGRIQAPVYVRIGTKTYATPYTIRPTLTRLRRWYRLAREMGDTRFIGKPEPGERGEDNIPLNPRGMRWCPACEGINPLSLTRCIWCRRELPPPGRSLPPHEGSSGD